MAFKDQVRQLIEVGLNDYPSLFLIDFSISADNKITVVIDGDEGVVLQNCIDLSRSIENNLDREEQDFSLEVASAGATSPLKLPRQYRKNVGRTLEVVLENEVIEAKLIAADDEKISLEWMVRQPKKVGKGKETVQKSAEILYDNIKKAQVVISF